jgi:hypothetical protein
MDTNLEPSWWTLGWDVSQFIRQQVSEIDQFNGEISGLRIPSHNQLSGSV